MNKFICAVGAFFLITGAADADNFGLPDEVSWTVYANIGTTQAEAIGAALASEAGAHLNLVAGADDKARTKLLRDGTVDFAATAVGGSVAAQEGAFAFAEPDWGPQKVRLVLANTAEPLNYAVAVAGDLGAETYADLKGKRVAWYTNYPVVNVNTEAYLAYGGLAWDDVERVEVAGFFSDALKALHRGELDAAFAVTAGPDAAAIYPVADGKRGLVWPPVDPADAAAIERMEAVAPYFVPHDAAKGTDVGAESGQRGAHYPYPILVGLEATDGDLAYAMTKALVELFPHYQGKAMGIDGWAVNPDKLLWFVPYHEGAVRYLKEAGVWTEAAQAHNDTLIARQEALRAAWDALKAEAPADWPKAWTERRRQALTEGGFQVIF